MTMTSTGADRDVASIHATEAHVHSGASKQRLTGRVGEEAKRRPGSLPVHRARKPGVNANRVGIPANQPRIGALSDDGGFTNTYVPTSGSQVPHTATPSLCLINALHQRGSLRPAGGVQCDIGAVESGAAPDWIVSDDFE